MGTVLDVQRQMVSVRRERDAEYRAQREDLAADLRAELEDDLRQSTTPIRTTAGPVYTDRVITHGPPARQSAAIPNDRGHLRSTLGTGSARRTA